MGANRPARINAAAEQTGSVAMPTTRVWGAVSIVEATALSRASVRHTEVDVTDALIKPLCAGKASLNRALTARAVWNLRDGRPGYVYSGNESPNIGLPLLDCS
jgi:hypothetical protein